MPNLMRKTVAVFICVACLMFWCVPASAISIKEEKALADEFMRYLAKRYELITDPMVVRYVNAVGQRILAALPPQPFNYKFHVIKEPVYNAFAIPAGHIFIHSGLLAAMESEEELAGILGHEIAHVTHRHISKRIDRSKKIGLATMAGMVAGIFLGATTGDSSAASALTIGSVAAGQTASLSFSRQDEAQSDQSGISYIMAAGYHPRGLLKVLRRIRSKQWFGSEQIPTYMMTHPALEERLANIDTWMDLKAKKGELSETRQWVEPGFKKINIRLRAIYSDPETTLPAFRKALDKDPEDLDVAYGYGLALAQSGERHTAIRYLRKALARDALDPVILVDLGRVYFLDGQYEAALNTLQGAVSITTKSNPEGQFYLGRTQQALNQLKKAAASYERLISDHPEYLQAYYFLGETYGKSERMPEAHYYLGLYHYKKREHRIARFHLQRARKSVKDPKKLAVIDEALKAMGPPPKETP